MTETSMGAATSKIQAKLLYFFISRELKGLEIYIQAEGRNHGKCAACIVITESSGIAAVFRRIAIIVFEGLQVLYVGKDAQIPDLPARYQVPAKAVRQLKVADPEITAIFDIVGGTIVIETVALCQDGYPVGCAGAMPAADLVAGIIHPLERRLERTPGPEDVIAINAV